MERARRGRPRARSPSPTTTRWPACPPPSPPASALGHPGGRRLRVQLGRAVGRDARAGLLPPVALGRAGVVPRALPRRPRPPRPRDGDPASAARRRARLRRRAAAVERRRGGPAARGARDRASRAAPSTCHEAFDRYIGRGRPAFVDKTLPAFREIADLVHSVRGLVSVAHIKERGTRSFLERLKREGLDAVETRHPSHDPELRARLTDIALRLGLLRTGGSDWHGDPEPGRDPRRASAPSRCRSNGWSGWRSCGPRRPRRWPRERTAARRQPRAGFRRRGVRWPPLHARASCWPSSRVLLAFYPGNDTPG